MKDLLLEKIIRSLQDNSSLKFKEIKELLSKASAFSLETKEIPKGKKVLLSYLTKEGKIILASNISEIKTGGKKINEYLKVLDTDKQEFESFINNLERNLNSMSPEDQSTLFGTDGNIFYNIIYYTKPDGYSNFNTKFFSLAPDGHGEYDKSGKMIVNEVSRQVNKLEELLEKWSSKLKYEKYNLESSAIRKLNELHNKEYINYANKKIDSCLSSANQHIDNDKFSLSDESTVDDYILIRVYILLNAALDKSNAGHYDPYAKMNIAKRLLGIQGISSNDILKKLQPEQQTFVKENILNDINKKDFLKTAIKPLEDVIINYSIEILKAMQAIIVLNNTVSYKTLNKQIDNSIRHINLGNNLNTLKTELKNVKFIENKLNKPQLSFYHEGKLYKCENKYSPISELLSLFKPLSEKTLDKKVIDESDIKIFITETIRKKGNKYCLLSKKTKKNLGCFRSKRAAKKREKQVQYFKHIKEISSIGGGDVTGFGGFDQDKME